MGAISGQILTDRSKMRTFCSHLQSFPLLTHCTITIADFSSNKTVMTAFILTLFRSPATNLDVIDTSLIDIDHELANVPRAFTDTDAKKVFYRTSVFLSVPLLTLLLFAGNQSVNLFTEN